MSDDQKPPTSTADIIAIEAAREERKERRRLEKEERVRKAKQEAKERAREKSEENARELAKQGIYVEDFGDDGAFDDQGNRIRQGDGPRMPPSLPAYELVAVDANSVRVDEETMPWEQRLVYLRELAAYGSLNGAAWAAGIDITTATHLRANDPEFASQCREAAEVFKTSIDREIVRRGRDGWWEPVFSPALGYKIGQKRMFDSNLLTLMAKKRMPDVYGDAPTATLALQGVLIMPRRPAQTSDEWFEEVANEPARPALKAPAGGKEST